ncbi:MAG TPA: hypothetical protein VF929_03295 [Gemmatimonadaceae bacterium]
MASWQVEFHVVPRRALDGGQSLTPAILENTAWWTSATFPPDYRRRLSSVAELARSSTTDLERWGIEDGDRVDVWSVDGQVSRVTVSVDVRRLNSTFGAALLAFVRAAGAVLVRNDGVLVEPTINAYAGALRGSRAWRYSNDPMAFLAAQEKIADDAE